MGVPAKKQIEFPFEDDSASAESSGQAKGGAGVRLSAVPVVAGDELGFWKDVFVQQPLPWGRFLQSAVLHATAVGLIWGMSLAWLRQEKILAPSQFDRSQVITYSPNEYLPPLDTGAAAAPKQQKGEPAFAKQPILSVPREPDNRSQTIVAPSNLKLDHDVPLPNIIARGAIAPVVPLNATRSLSSRVAAPDTQVVAPTPDANFTREHADRAALRSDIIPPPPEVTHDRARGVAGPEAAIVEPPPEVTTAKGRSGLINIGPSQVVAPAPQLTVAEQHTTGRGRGGKGALTGNVEPVGPPPSVAASGGSGSQGRLIALGIRPVAPTGPVAVPNGSRAGQFEAGPNGKAGAAGTPDLKGSKSAANGAGGTAAGSGSKGRGNGSLPAGLHVGAGTGATGNVQRDGKSPNGSGFGDGTGREVASASADHLAAKHAGQKPASVVSDDKITDLDRQVFGDRHPYAMTVNMPNLNSFTGSWVLRFAEMTPDQKQGDLLAPVPMEKSDPGYPLELMKNNVHGQVTLYAVIHSDGKVGDIRVLSSPDDRLDRYAASALARWKFAPAERDGRPVAIEAVVVIPFRTRIAF
jgi:TonB family protein